MTVPERLVPQAAAAESPAPEPSVDGRKVRPAKLPKGAEHLTPKAKPRKPVWPSAGKAEIDIGKDLTPAGELPVLIASPGKNTTARTTGTSPNRVSVQTYSHKDINKLGGIGIAARVVRADQADQPGPVQAAFSYQSFRDAHGANFTDRLQLVRLPACALSTPRPRDCAVGHHVIKTRNDAKNSRLIADVQADPAKPSAVARPQFKGKDKAAAAKAATDASLQAGSVYMLMAGMAGSEGNFGATDLKPAGTWQAGTSGGGFTYNLPLPEAPSPADTGPGLALNYDASSVDGQGSWTNNQSGAAGIGWELNTGFIERKFRRCHVDNFFNPNYGLVWTANETGSTGNAICWESPHENDNDPATNDKTQSELVLSVGGRSAQIIKDVTTGAWKTVPDLGWKIEGLAGGAGGNDYWRITTTEGTVYRFGFNADSQWNLPYVGNEPGEPCYDRYYNDFSPPVCSAEWRWNLDQEIDAKENVVDYTYSREENWFCLPGCSHTDNFPMSYDRGGVLAEAQWGHNTQVAGSAATTRTVFTTMDRGTADVPNDLRCDFQVGCANGAIAFFSTRKLQSVAAQARLTPTSSWVTSTDLSLAHTFVNTRNDFGVPDNPVMWLDTVQQTGHATGSPITLPPIDFDAVMLAGKMVYHNISDWQDQLSWRMVPRIGAIGNAMGGRIEVTYGQADPCSGGQGRDGSNYHADHTGDCYKIDNSSPWETLWTVYYKQLVTKVTERDMVTASPDMVTAYEYLGGPGWASPEQYHEPGFAPPSTDWRGYATVRTLEGSGTDPADYTINTATFFRGMGGTVTNFEGGTVTDARALQGHLLQEQKWTMSSYSPRTYAEAESQRFEYEVRSTGNGPGVHEPVMVLDTRERARELVTGPAWRWTDSFTTYDSYGHPSQVNDHGDTSTAADNTCVTTTYARNTTAWLISYPSVQERRSGDSCASGALIGKTVTLYDGGTDPATNSPSDGNVTETRNHASASTISTTKSTFDDYGRPLTSTDPLNKTTTSSYSPATGWPSTGVTTTNPLGAAHTTTTVSSYLIGLPTSVTDANNKTYEIDYDALGRTTTLWGPGEPRSAGTATVTIAYDIPSGGWMAQPSGPVKTTTRRLLSGTGANAVYTSEHSYEDGLGRTRETQTESPAGGRIVNVAAYDGRGLVTATSGAAHNSAAAGSGLLNPALTTLPQWSRTQFDGLERPTAVIDFNLSTELRRTTHAYSGGDKVETTPPTGGKTATVTDAAGQTVKTEEWKDATVHHDTTYAYDRSGNLTAITDARGKERTFTYDWLRQRTAATDPDSGSSSAGYDAAGRLTWSTDGNGTKVSNVYDDLGRRTSQWAGDPGTGTKLAEWTYDTVAKGHPATATRYAGGNAYTDSVTAYDHAYRPTATRTTIPAAEGALAGTYDFTAAFDKAGNMTGYGMPAAGGLPAENLTLTYTGLGLPKSLTSNLGGTTTYVKDTLYTATGRLSERSYGPNSQVKRNFTWDEGTGRLTRLTTTAKADTPTPNTAQDDRFTYNTAGEITRILDAASAVPGSPGQSECFTYDGLHRLTAAHTTTAAACGSGADNQGIDPYNQTYAYDATGNITALTDGGTTSTYSYPTAAGAARPNAVTTITRTGTNPGNDTYAYDNAGQMTARTQHGQQSTYTWNPLGQL
ncbi:hypothetical protein, partial [Sinosporangium album]